MFLVNNKWGSEVWQDIFVLQSQKESEDFESCPGAWILRIGFKGGGVNVGMGASMLKHLYTEEVEMEIESEWYKATKILITKEGNNAER